MSKNYRQREEGGEGRRCGKRGRDEARATETDRQKKREMG